MGGKRTLAERELVQLDVGKAEGLLRSARAFVYETATEALAATAAGALGPEERALVRLAATQATHASAQAVDLAYRAGGSTSIYAKSALQRCFRDVHVATQHGMVAEPTFALAGRVLLGLPTDATQL
jgi:alkylation response protein AidB-like acyl-CoA dehydrogenase